MMDSLSAEDKNDLRRYYLNQRSKLSAEAVRKKSKMATDRIIGSERFKNAEIIHSYIPIQNKNELDTLPIINYALTNKKTVVVPKVADDNRLGHYVIESLDDLKTNKWNIPEPVGGTKIEPRRLSLVIVPMVAGDRKKNRIGYGKGYYDRFLIGLKAFKIGVLFDCQLSDKYLPVEPFDVPLDRLVTESQII